MISFSSAAVWTEGLNDNLTAYYKFEESSGNATDSHDTNDATASGITYGATGRIGDAFTFQYDEADHVTTPSISITSVSLWIKVDEIRSPGAQSFFLDARDGISNAWMRFDNVGGDAILDWNPGGWTTVYLDGSVVSPDVEVLTNGTWYHIVAISAGGTDDLKIGADRSNAGIFDGEIDEVGIWNRTLSPSEISDLHNNGSGITYTNDFLPPQWSDDSTDDTEAGTSILHSVKWTDGTALSGYIFSFDNGTGSFTNDSFVTMSGGGDWSNVSKFVNTNVGSTIRWRVYSNDSENQFNSTDIFEYNTTFPSATFEDVTVINDLTVGNDLTATQGFFDHLGSSISRIIKGWFIDIDALSILTQNLTSTNLVTQNILVNSKDVCLDDGTNCPSSGDTDVKSGSVSSVTEGTPVTVNFTTAFSSTPDCTVSVDLSGSGSATQGMAFFTNAPTTTEITINWDDTKGGASKVENLMWVCTDAGN